MPNTRRCRSGIARSLGGPPRSALQKLEDFDCWRRVFWNHTNIARDFVVSVSYWRAANPQRTWNNFAERELLALCSPIESPFPCLSGALGVSVSRWLGSRTTSPGSRWTC